MNSGPQKASVNQQMHKIKNQLSQRIWWSPRGFLLFVLPLPLLPALVISLGKGDLHQSLVHVAAIALFLTGALATRRGLKQELIEHEKDKRPLPLKAFAALIISLATGMCSWLAVDHSLLFSLLVSALTFVGFYMSYGVESLSQYTKVQETVKSDQQTLDHTIAEAQQKISMIEDYARELANTELKQRLQRISQLARDIIIRIEQQPADRHRARKFLYVYLDGALQVTEGYAKTHKQANLVELEDKFRNVLNTIEDVFKQQKQHFLENDILDLDVQIEVLTKQMQQEGIR